MKNFILQEERLGTLFFCVASDKEDELRIREICFDYVYVVEAQRVFVMQTKRGFERVFRFGLWQTERTQSWLDKLLNTDSRVASGSSE